MIPTIPTDTFITYIPGITGGKTNSYTGLVAILVACYRSAPRASVDRHRFLLGPLETFLHSSDYHLQLFSVHRPIEHCVCCWRVTETEQYRAARSARWTKHVCSRVVCSKWHAHGTRSAPSVTTKPTHVADVRSHATLASKQAPSHVRRTMPSHAR